MLFAFSNLSMLLSVTGNSSISKLGTSLSDSVYVYDEGRFELLREDGLYNAARVAYLKHLLSLFFTFTTHEVFRIHVGLNLEYEAADTLVELEKEVDSFEFNNIFELAKKDRRKV